MARSFQICMDEIKGSIKNEYTLLRADKKIGFITIKFLQTKKCNLFLLIL